MRGVCREEPLVAHARFGALAGVVLEAGARVEHLGGRRKAPLHLLVFASRLRRVAAALEQRRAVEERRQQVGLELERRRVGGKRLVGTALLAEHVAEVEVCTGVDSVDAQGAAILAFGALELPLALQHVAEQHVEVGALRFVEQREADVALGFVKLAGEEGGVRKEVVRVRMVRGDVEHCGERRARVDQPASLQALEYRLQQTFQA